MGRLLWEEILSIARLLTVVAVAASSFLYLYWFTETGLRSYVFGFGMLVAVGVGVVACLKIARVCSKIGNRLHKSKDRSCKADSPPTEAGR